MVNTDATRISATFFHKHKYIYNPMVTPSAVIVTAAKNLVKTLKEKLPHCLQESPLAKVTRLIRIFFSAVAESESNLKPYNPVVPEPKTVGNSAPRRSTRLATHVDQER